MNLGYRDKQKQFITEYPLNHMLQKCDRCKLYITSLKMHNQFRILLKTYVPNL